MNFKKSLIENVVLSTGDRLLKTSFISKLKEWRKTLSKSKSALEALQKDKLSKLLQFSSLNSPYYKNLGIALKKDPYAWLSEFPVLKKKEFKENLDLILTRPTKEGLTMITSSGSTGPASKVYFSKDELSNNRALQVIWWEWAGYEFGNSLLQTGINMTRSKEKLIKDKVLKTRYIDALSHDEKSILEELKHLQENPRDHFIAYASSLFLFAKTAQKYQINDVRFKSIVSIGEKLMPHFKTLIEEMFSCQVYDTYGASEGFLIASQCKAGQYHILSPHVVVEILNDEDEEVKPGETGRVVLTGLDNFSMPLIRYEVGDLAVKGEEINCSCGLELPVLKEVIGRQTEFLLTENGKYITVQTVVRLMKSFPSVDQFRIIQKGPNHFLLQYVSDSILTSGQEKALTEDYQHVVGQMIKIDFEYCQAIPKAKSGKFQLIQNDWKDKYAAKEV